MGCHRFQRISLAHSARGPRFCRSSEIESQPHSGWDVPWYIAILFPEILYPHNFLIFTYDCLHLPQSQHPIFLDFILVLMDLLDGHLFLLLELHFWMELSISFHNISDSFPMFDAWNPTCSYIFHTKSSLSEVFFFSMIFPNKSDVLSNLSMISLGFPHVKSPSFAGQHAFFWRPLQPRPPRPPLPHASRGSGPFSIDA